jgi:hypothetical protein
LGLSGIKLSIFPKQIPILVFTMAKVGSLSVYFSLKKVALRQSIFHIHSLDEKEVKNGIKLCFDNNLYPGSKSPVFLINKKIIKKGKPYKIISLFRDPLERNISAFFEVFELHTGEKPKDFSGDMNEMKQLYHEKLNHDFPLNWFEKQFLEATKINVYSYDFDKESGFQTIKNNNIEVLLINSNVADHIKEELIRDFCGFKSFTLYNRNVSSTKEYASYYKEFKDNIKFSSAYLNKLYDSNYVRHFFTEKHIENQKERWIG